MSDLFYRYANSHLYDIYAALSGTLVFLCMLLVKKPVKRLTAEAAGRRALGAREEYVYRRRLNMILPLLAEAVGVGFFYGCARLGGQVAFSWGSALSAGLIAMAEYAFVEQVV